MSIAFFVLFVILSLTVIACHVNTPSNLSATQRIRRFGTLTSSFIVPRSVSCTVLPSANGTKQLKANLQLSLQGLNKQTAESSLYHQTLANTKIESSNNRHAQKTLFSPASFQRQDESTEIQMMLENDTSQYNSDLLTYNDEENIHEATV